MSKKAKIILTSILAVVLLPAGYFLVRYGPQGQIGQNQEQREITFQKPGYLVKNNPGMDAGVWYLLYEEPGVPAIAVKLLFDQSSKCFGQVCNVSTLETGNRINVSGTMWPENSVMVQSLGGE